MNDATQIIVYSRPGCELCEEMLAELEFSLLGKSLDFTVINIDTDPQLIEKYGLDIPVLMVNGDEVCRHHLDSELLANKLSKST